MLSFLMIKVFLANKIFMISKVIIISPPQRTSMLHKSLSPLERISSFHQISQLTVYSSLVAILANDPVLVRNVNADPNLKHCCTEDGGEK